MRTGTYTLVLNAHRDLHVAAVVPELGAVARHRRRVGVTGAPGSPSPVPEFPVIVADVRQDERRHVIDADLQPVPQGAGSHA